MEEKKQLTEEALKKVSGGFLNDAGAVGGYEAPIVLDTDEKVRSFTDSAMQCSFDVRVRDRANSADGKDYAQVLALNRTGFVTVSVVCRYDDPFRAIINRYMDF